MDWPTATNGAFTLRDYIKSLFPGLLVLFGLYFIWPDLAGNIDIQKYKASLVVISLVGGYIVGDICVGISWYIMFPILNKIFGDPAYNLLNVNSKWGKTFSAEFRDKIIEKAKGLWGNDFIEAISEKELHDLCLSYIQNIPSQRLFQLERMMSAYNSNLSFIVAFFFATTSIIYNSICINNDATLTTLVLLAAILLELLFIRRYFDNRKIHTQMIYEIFLSHI